MNLANLVSKDLTTVETDELVAGVRDARTTEDQLLDWTAQIVRELRARNLSWSKLVELTGVPQTTLWRLANKDE